MRRTNFFKLILFMALILPVVSIVNVLAFDLDPGGSGGSDTTPPNLTITAPTFTQTYSRSVTISWTATDASGILKCEVKLDGGSWINKGSSSPNSHTFANLAYGLRTFYVRAYDTKNNYIIKSKTVTILIDNILPVVDVIYPKLCEITPSTFTASWEAYDNCGISANYVKLDDGDWICVGLSSTYEFVDVSYSLHNLYVKVVDTSNNEGTTGQSFYILETGSYYIQLQSSHKTEWYPGLDPYCYANVDMNYKIWFDYDESTQRVSYTHVYYKTEVSYYNSPGYYVLSRNNPTMYDSYITWVYDSWDGDIHTPEYPAIVLITGDLGFEREFEREITEGWYNTDRFYAGIYYDCRIMVNYEQWKIECRLKCDGNPDFFVTSWTNTPGVGSGIEWNDYLLSYSCNINEV